jgi:hypothetical protein
MKTLLQQLETLGIYAQRFSRHTTNQLQDAGLLTDLITQTNFLDNPGLSERLYTLKEGITTRVKCTECKSNYVKFISPSKGYRPFCSKSCQGKSPITRNKVKDTMQLRHGVTNAFNIAGVQEKAIIGTKKPEAQLKRQETCMEKYGVKYNSQAEVVKEKKIKTSLQKFGTEHSMQADEIKEKIKQTCQVRYDANSFFGSDTGKSTVKSAIQKKYGFDNYMDSPEFRAKSQKTLFNNYGVTNPSLSVEIIAKIKETHNKNHDSYYSAKHIPNAVLLKLQDKEWLIEQHTVQKKSLPQIADELGDVTHKTVWNYFVNHQIEINRFCFSYAETVLYDFLSSIGIKNIIRNDREILNGKEIDLFLPDYNIAIEFNGLYWHSTKFRGKYSHVDKFLALQEKGIHLISIFEDEWMYKQEIVKSRLKSIFNCNETIYARKCTIKSLTAAEYREFSNQHHLQGYAPAKFKYGLLYNDQIVAIMSFGTSRYTNDQFELIRYCSTANITGGASKLFSHFTKKHNPCSIISYADRCWSNGNLYRKLGFDDITSNIRNVGYSCFYKNKKYHRSNFTKKKLIKLGHDPALTAVQILENMGVYQIYNCGNYKFIWNK